MKIKKILKILKKNKKFKIEQKISLPERDSNPRLQFALTAKLSGHKLLVF
jgi:hypothetical protein